MATEEMENHLPLAAELALSLLHAMIEKMPRQAPTRKSTALRRAIEQLNAHVARRMQGLSWPPPKITSKAKPQGALRNDTA
jgi:hypothetical protein